VLVVAGNVTLDDTVLPDGRTVMGVVGGDVLYSGLAAALWTRPVGLLSRVGDDFSPHDLDRVRAAGLDTAGIHLHPGPTIRYWIVYEWDGRRHFILRTPEERLHALSPEPDELPPAYARMIHAVHVAAMPFDQVERLVRAAAALPSHPSITLDTHEDFVDGYQGRFAELLPLLAAFLPSREEVALWFGYDDPEQAIARLLDLGPGAVVIKMGAAGALAQGRGEDRPRLVPPVPTDVRDVTGAGDAFCGGFAARLADGAGVLDAAMAGAVAASFAVERHGSLGLIGVDARVRDERLARLRGMMEGSATV